MSKHRHRWNHVSKREFIYGAVLRIFGNEIIIPTTVRTEFWRTESEGGNRTGQWNPPVTPMPQMYFAWDSEAEARNRTRRWNPLTTEVLLHIRYAILTVGGGGGTESGCGNRTWRWNLCVNSVVFFCLCSVIVLMLTFVSRPLRQIFWEYEKINLTGQNTVICVGLHEQA